MEPKQMHVDVPRKLWKDFLGVLPEKRLVSVIIRGLIRNFIAEMKKNPTSIGKYLTKE